MLINIVSIYRRASSILTEHQLVVQGWGQLAVTTAFCSTPRSKNVTVLCWLSHQIHIQQLPDFKTPITTEMLKNIDNRLW